MFIAILLPKQDLLTRPHFIVSIPHIDKVVHCGLFAVFTFLFYKVMYLRTTGRNKMYFYLIGVSVVFGLFTEILQALLFEYIQRTFSWWDFCADVLGVIIAIIGCLILKKRETKRTE